MPRWLISKERYKEAHDMTSSSVRQTILASRCQNTRDTMPTLGRTDHKGTYGSSSTAGGCCSGAVYLTLLVRTRQIIRYRAKN